MPGKQHSRSSSLDDVQQPFLSTNDEYAAAPLAPPKPRLRKDSKIACCAVLVLLALFLLAILLPPDPIRLQEHVRSNETLTPIPILAGVNEEDDTGNWTLPMPPAPLTPGAMARTCAAVHHHSHTHRGYYWVDPKFVDPTAAATGGNGSLTYYLSGSWGMAESLLEVFTAYGLALHEGREFVLDHEDWLWGAWGDYFSSKPTFASSRGVAELVGLPCPRSTHHLSVSHATSTFVFGHAFIDEFENPTKAGSLRQDRIFALMHVGSTALLRLRPELRREVEKRKKELIAEADMGGGAWVGIQVRKGDWKPRTWGWRKAGNGVPLDAIADAAAELSEGEGRVVVMSDDPEVPGAPQLAGSHPAVLGAEGMLEGGWSREKFAELEMGERISTGRRFLVEMMVIADLVKVGEADTGGVVCAAGSAACRLLAVLLGWDKSILKERWKDIDGGLGWSGVNW
jgi:hypothetical protein